MRSTANLQYAVYQHTCSLIYHSKSNQTVRQFSSHNVKTIKTVSFCGKFFNGRWLLYRFHRIESADVCVLTSLLNKYSLKMSFSKCPNQTWDLSKNLHDQMFGPKFLHTKINSVDALISIILVDFLYEFNWVCKV